MDERHLIVAVLTALVVVFVASRRWPGVGKGGRRLGKVDLNPGVYLFGSATCLSCQPARDRLRRSVGDRLIEVGWEGHQKQFEELSIDEIPTTVIVDSRGQARAYPGTPPDARVLERAVHSS